MSEVAKLSKEEKWELIRKMYMDIDLFAHTCLPHTVYESTPPFHKDIYDYLERDDIKKLAVICPRGHAKSTLATKIYPLHRIVFNQANFIIIASESHDQSINLLRDIREELEFNDILRDFFGDLTSEGKWTEKDMITKNGVRVWARGSRQRIRGSKYKGRRPDLIILDDFESELNTETPEQRDKLKKWVNGAVIPAIDPQCGKIFLIGTIIHEDSYLSDIKDDDVGKLGWHRRIYKAGLPEGKPLWEDLYPLSWLRNKRDELASQGYEHIYYQEYENEAISPDQGLAKNIVETQYEVKWSEHDGCWFINEGGVWKAMFTFLGLDPSRGTLGGDPTGEVVVGTTSDNVLYVLEANELRLGTYDLINRIFDTMKKWRCRSLVIETVTFQEILKDMVYKEMPRKDMFFGVREEKPKDRKGIRLRGLSPYYYGGHIYHNGFFPDLVRQLRSFPKSKHDDLLDGLWFAIKGTYRPSPKTYNPSKKDRPRIVKRKEYNWAVL